MHQLLHRKCQQHTKNKTRSNPTHKTLQVYVKEKRKSEVAVSIPLTSKQLAQLFSGWEERTGQPEWREAVPLRRHGGSLLGNEANGLDPELWVWEGLLSQNFTLYRSLESFYLKPNLFYWQRPWAFSAQTAIPRGRSPSRLTTLGGVGLPLQPFSRAPSFAHSRTPRVSLRGEGGQALQRGSPPDRNG